MKKYSAVTPKYSVKTPPPPSVSKEFYDAIKLEIATCTKDNVWPANDNVWPKGCKDIDRLFDFIKGKPPNRERLTIFGTRCENNKITCAKGCNPRCELTERICPIRSNKDNIKDFMKKFAEYLPSFQLLFDTCEGVHDRKFIIQMKLLSIASECHLTHVSYTEEDISKLDKKAFTNDFFQRTLKVQSFVLHAIAVALIEPILEPINYCLDSFIENYHMLTELKVDGTKRTCDPSEYGGWYNTFRANELTLAFFKIFGSENCQLACSIVCTLSYGGTQSPIHGGRKSPGLLTSHVIWDKLNVLETSECSPRGIADICETSERSPRPIQGENEAPERPTKIRKDEHSIQPKILFQSLEWLPEDFLVHEQFEPSNFLLDEESNQGGPAIFDANMGSYAEAPLEIELLDILLFADFVPL